MNPSSLFPRHAGPTARVSHRIPLDGAEQPPAFGPAALGPRPLAPPRRTVLFRALCLFVVLLSACRPAANAEGAAVPSGDLSPCALAISADGESIYVACASANQVLVLSGSQRGITRRFAVPGSPSGLVLSGDGKRLFVTCAAPASLVCLVELPSGKVLKTLAAGYTALSPVLSPDGQTLFVCNRFNDAVSVFDLTQDKEVARITVDREPVSAALTHDGRSLLVANHLPKGRNDVSYVAATVSVIDVARREVVKEVRLPNGSINLRDLRVSPDGKYACLAQTVGRFQVPVTQLTRGWVNTSVLTLIDLRRMETLNSVVLDDVDCGAANPWAVAWSADGRLLCVTHAGTHELSIIDFPALLKKLEALPAAPPPAMVNSDAACRCAADVPNDLSFLQGLRRRVKLTGNGPRGLALAGSRAWIASYFSDSLDVVDLSAGAPAAEGFPLNSGHPMTNVRRGEMYFNDATLCFQGWQSCAGCHDDDGRVDALHWDLLNDGIGNPKDTKSLIWAHRTPPSMSLGVRANASVAVRNGIQNSLGTVQPQEVPQAMDDWLRSLEPAPSPWLVHGRPSQAAQRGEILFNSPEVGCANCHEPPLFTDLRSYDVGTQNPFDKEARDFDTPTLRELWRTAPYLHDGSAPTLRDVVITRNPKHEHGKTSHLSPGQVDDLVAYLQSL